MAAHPFGPIENQLIVGYYKRGKHPRNAQLTYKYSDLLVPGPTGLPIHRFLQPVFYGWSPANGNSSSHDFRVSCRLKMEKPMELLSRGLGYRITFTMPEQEIDVGKPNTWPEAVVEVCDLFGESVLQRFVCHHNDWSLVLPADRQRELFTYLSQFRALVFEVMFDHVKVTENATEEYCFPVYDPSGSPLNEILNQATIRHKEMLESLLSPHNTDPETAHGDTWRWLEHLTMNLESMVRDLVTHNREASKENLLRLGVHFGPVSNLVGYLTEQGCWDHEEGTYKEMYENTAKEVKSWLDGTGEYPEILAPPEISILPILIFDRFAIPDPIKAAISHLGPEERKEVDRFRFFKLQNLLRLVALIMETGIEQPFNEKVIYQTQNFFVVDAGTSDCVKVKFHKNRQRLLFDLDMTHFGGPDRLILALPGSDKLISLNKKAGNPFFMIDLDQVYRECMASKMVQNPHKQLNGWDMFEDMTNLTICEASLSKFGCSILLSHSVGTSVSGVLIYRLIAEGKRKFQFSKTAKHTFPLNFGGLWKDSRHRIYHGRLSQSNDGKLIFCGYTAASALPRIPSHLCFGCYRHKPSSTKLELVASWSKAFAEVQSPKCQFVKSKKGHMFVLAFTSETRVAGFVFWQDTFIAVGSQQPDRPRTRKLLKSEVELQDPTKGLLGFRIIESTDQTSRADGYHVYRVGRLYFKY